MLRYWQKRSVDMLIRAARILVSVSQSQSITLPTKAWMKMTSKRLTSSVTPILLMLLMMLRCFGTKNCGCTQTKIAPIPKYIQLHIWTAVPEPRAILLKVRAERRPNNKWVRNLWVFLNFFAPYQETRKCKLVSMRIGISI